MQPAEAHNNSEFLETYEVKKTVEELLQCPYWIIDILPSQVPEDSPGQFFSVEEYFLQGDRIKEIKQKHIDLILKLNCYRDIRSLIILGILHDNRFYITLSCLLLLQLFPAC